MVLALGLGAVLVYSIYRVLLPQVDLPHVRSRYAWPTVARLSLGELDALAQERSDDGDTYRREAWAQASVLSRICAAKFRWVAVATRTTCLMLGVLAAVHVVGSL